MSSRRLRWRGVSQQRTVLVEMQRLLGLWLKGWSVDGELLSLRLADSQAELSSERRWLRLDGKNGGAWLGVSSGAAAQLGGLLSGTGPGGAPALGARVGERALRALLATWAGVVAADASAYEDAAPMPEDLQPRFGGLRFQLEGGGFAAAVVASGTLCDFLVAPVQLSLPPVAPRDAGLGGESIELRVMLDLGEASLADAHGLQVGDVLVSRASLDSVFHLSSNDSRPLASGRIYRQGERRALRVDAGVPARKNP